MGDKSAIDAVREQSSIDKELASALGQPLTKYYPDRCTEVQEILNEGFSLRAAAGAMGITFSTLQKWREQYPEFNEACEIGESQRVHTLESKLLETNDSVIANVRLRALKNANREAWADKTEHESNVTVNFIDVLRQLSEDIEQRKIANDIETIPFVEAAE